MIQILLKKKVIFIFVLFFLEKIRVRNISLNWGSKLRYLLIPFLLLIGLQSTFAQRNVIKLTLNSRTIDGLPSPFEHLVAFPSISYERALSYKTSYVVELRNYISAYNLGSLESVHNGIRLLGEYRYYFNQKKVYLRGFYGGLNVSLGAHKINDFSEGQAQSDASSTSVATCGQTGSCKETGTTAVFSTGLKLGWQFRIKRFVVDIGQSINFNVPFETRFKRYKENGRSYIRGIDHISGLDRFGYISLGYNF